MSIFSSLFKGGTYLGVDIGTTSIKVVELQKSGRGIFTLVNYAILETSGHLERFNNALQSSNLKLLDTDIIAYLKLLTRRTKFKTNRVNASLPSFSAFTTLLELPVMSDHEITQTVKFQSRNYIPLPISTVTIDWLKVGEREAPDGSRKQQVLLISVPNEQVEKYTDIFQQVGLTLETLEIEGISQARALTIGVEKPMLIIDIGGRSTTISVAKNGALKFTGQTDFASGSITHALGAGLSISDRRAEDLKRQTQLMGAGGEHELSTIMIPIVDVIINEANRVKSNFEGSYQEGIAGVLLSGAGANMNGLDAYIGQQLKLPAKRANPFENINYPPEIEPLAHTLGPTLTTAIGLCLKNLG